MKNSALKRLTRLVGKAIGDFGLIQDQDRILVALSGGKDSWSLLYALRDLQRKAPIKYDLAAVTIHPGQTEFDCRPMGERLRHDGITHWVVQGNLVELIDEKLTPGTNPCSFCSRLRRGMLYTFAAERQWNKIALGHHTDDFVETLLLNLFFNGSIKGMSPNLVSDDGRNRVIRPLVYAREDLTRECAGMLGVPILGCYCNCMGMKGARRQWVKALLKKIEKDVPDVCSNILHSMGRIHHRHLFTAWEDRLQNAPLLNVKEGVN